MGSAYKRRDFLSLAVSIGVHIVAVLMLAVLPAESQKKYSSVDLDVSSIKPKEPLSPLKPENLPDKTEKKTPKREPLSPKQDNEPPPLAPPKEEEKAKEDAKEAPPVFDLGDNTFATEDGQSGGWSLNRSEGNTKFAGLAKNGQPSVRGTKATGDDNGEPDGTGLAPVPIKDLSKRPMPKNGSIKIPAYPAEARREGIEGAVVLQVFIEKNGSVKRVRVIKDPGGGLGEVAKTSMLDEKWTPPLNKNGEPVNTVIIYSYRFVLDG